MLTTVDPRLPTSFLARPTRARCPSWSAPMVGTRTTGLGKVKLRRFMRGRDFTMYIWGRSSRVAGVHEVEKGENSSRITSRNFLVFDAFGVHTKLGIPDSWTLLDARILQLLPLTF